jgi:hypothetical protein
MRLMAQFKKIYKNTLFYWIGDILQYDMFNLTMDELEIQCSGC